MPEVKGRAVEVMHEAWSGIVFTQHCYCGDVVGLL